MGRGAMRASIRRAKFLMDPPTALSVSASALEWRTASRNGKPAICYATRFGESAAQLGALLDAPGRRCAISAASRHQISLSQSFFFQLSNHLSGLHYPSMVRISIKKGEVFVLRLKYFNLPSPIFSVILLNKINCSLRRPSSLQLLRSSEIQFKRTSMENFEVGSTTTGPRKVRLERNRHENVTRAAAH